MMETDRIQGCTKKLKNKKQTSEEKLERKGSYEPKA